MSHSLVKKYFGAYYVHKNDPCILENTEILMKRLVKTTP